MNHNLNLIHCAQRKANYCRCSWLSTSRWWYYPPWDSSDRYETWYCIDRGDDKFCRTFWAYKLRWQLGEHPRCSKSETDEISRAQCFEVCALGNIPKHVRETIRYPVWRRAARETFKTLAKIAMSASYYIFNRRRDKEWVSSPLFERYVVDFGAK